MTIHTDRTVFEAVSIAMVAICLGCLDLAAFAEQDGPATNSTLAAGFTPSDYARHIAAVKKIIGDKEFTIVCQIPTDFSPAETEEKQQPEKPKKEADDKGGETPANQPDKVAQNEPSKTPGPIVVNVLQDITKMLGRRNS